MQENQNNNPNISSSQKKIICALALIAVLSIATVITILPSASAHSPPWSVPTFAYVAAAPSVVGVNQNVYIMMWLDKVPPSAAGNGGDRWTNYKLKITGPTGKVETKGPYLSDPTSSTYVSYVPTLPGTYTIEFTFPGQVASLTNPVNGLPGSYSAYINDTYLASSATCTLTVQSTPVISPPEYPLPTGYWSRPIEGQNTGWAGIASNYLGYPQVQYGVYQRDGAAPNSPHIMWTKPLGFGGIVGGRSGNTGPYGASYYTGLSYEGRFANPLIIQGRLYYPLPKSDLPSGGGYVCVDLQTGQQYWYQNFTITSQGFSGATTVNPTFGQLYWYDSPNQHGVIPNGYLWITINDPKNGGYVWLAYDPFDGNWLFNETNTPGTVGGGLGTAAGGSTVYGTDGSIDMYVLGPTRTWIAMWNNTAAQDLVLTPGTTTNAWQFRPVNKNANASAAYSWNLTLQLQTPLPSGSSIRYVFPGDMIVMSQGNFGGVGDGIIGGNVFAISLRKGSEGTMLWSKHYDPTPNNTTRTLGPMDPVTRVFTMTDKETMQWLGFSLDDGHQLWGPVGNPPTFNYYGSIGTSGQTGFVAYGNLYTGGYGGVLYCYDLPTGTLKWSYGNGGVGNTTFAGDQTAWGNYPIFPGAIADGKIYLYSGEHSPNAPLYKGELLRAIDALTGKELWTLPAWAGIGSFGSAPLPVADGYLVYLNHYDDRIYVVGKGPSATSVEGPMSGATAGSVVTIRGTVTDQSAGAKGTPAISDADMSAWMQYVYMGKPMPSNAKGVPVEITAIAQDGTVTKIGHTDSDMGGSFGISWTPPSAGTYEIIANFTGTESYGGSYATTYIAVGSAVAAPSTNPTSTPSQTVTPIVTPSPTPVITPSPAVVSPTGGLNTAFYVAIAAVVIIAMVAAIAVILKRRK